MSSASFEEYSLSLKDLKRRLTTRRASSSRDSLQVDGPLRRRREESLPSSASVPRSESIESASEDTRPTSPAPSRRLAPRARQLPSPSATVTSVSTMSVRGPSRSGDSDGDRTRMEVERAAREAEREREVARLHRELADRERMLAQRDEEIGALEEQLQDCDAEERNALRLQAGELHAELEEGRGALAEKQRELESVYHRLECARWDAEEWRKRAEDIERELGRAEAKQREEREELLGRISSLEKAEEEKAAAAEEEEKRKAQEERERLGGDDMDRELQCMRRQLRALTEENASLRMNPSEAVAALAAGRRRWAAEREGTEAERRRRRVIEEELKMLRDEFDAAAACHADTTAVLERALSEARAEAAQLEDQADLEAQRLAQAARSAAKETEEEAARQRQLRREAQEALDTLRREHAAVLASAKETAAIQSPLRRAAAERGQLLSLVTTATSTLASAVPHDAAEGGSIDALASAVAERVASLQQERDSACGELRRIRAEQENISTEVGALGEQFRAAAMRAAEAERNLAIAREDAAGQISDAQAATRREEAMREEVLQELRSARDAEEILRQRVTRADEQGLQLQQKLVALIDAERQARDDAALARSELESLRTRLDEAEGRLEGRDEHARREAEEAAAFADRSRQALLSRVAAARSEERRAHELTLAELSELQKRCTSQKAAMEQLQEELTAARAAAADGTAAAAVSASAAERLGEVFGELRRAAASEVEVLSADLAMAQRQLRRMRAKVLDTRRTEKPSTQVRADSHTVTHRAAPDTLTHRAAPEVAEQRVRTVPERTTPTQSRSRKRVGPRVSLSPMPVNRN